MADEIHSLEVAHATDARLEMELGWGWAITCAAIIGRLLQIV